MKVAVNLGSFSDFKDFIADFEGKNAEIHSYESSLLGDDGIFYISGYCSICKKSVDFLVDYQYCLTTSDGRKIPNWRERLECPSCRLNNRMRSVGELLLSRSDSRIYLTEAITPLYREIKKLRRTVVGSEYLGDATPLGSNNDKGVRCEDVTKLTFRDAAFDAIGCFDVLEHVPNYKFALAEFFRCLEFGGTLIITAPFDLWLENTLVRATIEDNGKIVHHMPPEYHGDPLNESGVLSFYLFGWDLLDSLREAGFCNVYLRLTWNPDYGYLGGLQPVIIAKKANQKNESRLLTRILSFGRMK